jgi:putative transposase
MKLQYHTSSHSKYLIKYHLIIVCKYRKQLLKDIIDNDIKNIIFDISKMEDTKFDIDIMETDKDHIHLLIDCQPNISATSIVSRIKQISTIRIWKLHKELLQKEFWIENTFWSD